MGTFDQSSQGVLTAPGPPVPFRRQGTGGVVTLETHPFGDHDGDPAPRDVLDLYDEEAYRQTWEDAVHLKELDIERKKAEQAVVPGIDNEDLEALLRSFDKQVQNVHSIPPAYDVNVPPALDLHPSPDAEFTVDGVRVALERLYTSAVVGILRTIHEIQRIRHWEDEGYRTLVALCFYTYAWLHERVILLFLLFASLLILVPSSRAYLFSSAPYLDPSIDLTKLDPADPIKEAFDRQKDRWGSAATETSAREWANIMIDTVRSISQPKTGPGSGSKAKQVEGEIGEKVDERMKESMDKKKRGSLNADEQPAFLEHKDTMGEKERELEQEWEDKSEQQKAKEMYLQPTMRVIQGLADKWERAANALDPTPACALEFREWSVFLYIAPLIILSVIVSERLIFRMTGLAFGLFMFASPLLVHITRELDQAWPTWKIDLVLRYNILQDVPTNSQLILRILRRAEHARRPIPFNPKERGTLDGLRSDSDVISSDDEDDIDDVVDEQRRDPGGLTKRVMQSMGTRMHKMADSSRAKVRMMWDKVGERKERSAAVLTGHRDANLAGKASNVLIKLHIRDTTLGDKVVDKLPAASPAVYPQKPDCFYVWHKKHGAGHLLLYPPSSSPSLGARIEFTTLRPDPVSLNVTISHDTALTHSDQAYRGENRARVQHDSNIVPVAIPSERERRENLILPINCIVGIRKTGLKFPVRVAVGWALAAEGAGGTGLDITFVRPEGAQAVGHMQDAPGDGGGRRDKDTEASMKGDSEHEEEVRPTVAYGKEETIHLSGIVRRDELYRRLIAIGDQRWEVF